MKNIDLRKQSSAPDAPASTVTKVYSDANGYILQRDSNGADVLIGTQFSGSLSQTVVRVKAGSINITGAVFTSNPSAVTQTGLANPSLWIPVTYGGSGYLVPAYPLT